MERKLDNSATALSYTIAAASEEAMIDDRIWMRVGSGEEKVAVKER